jgi:beta-lactamase superfamily II metal-dependent hydrolase
VYVSGCDQYLLYRNPVLPSSPLLQIATMPISNQSKYHSAMAVRIEYGASSILYAAGLNSSEERVLVGNDSNLSCDVLILGGDQPEAAPLPEMMASSGAAVVALSCDSADPPSAESMRWFAASGASVGRTDILGDFELRLSGAPNQAITWRFEKRSTQKQ